MCWNHKQKVDFLISDYLSKKYVYAKPLKRLWLLDQIGISTMFTFQANFNGALERTKWIRCAAGYRLHVKLKQKETRLQSRKFQDLFPPPCNENPKLYIFPGNLVHCAVLLYHHLIICKPSKICRIVIWFCDFSCSRISQANYNHSFWHFCVRLDMYRQ